MTDIQERLEALLSTDPDHVYSEEELDAIEELDPELALRLDRAQTLARREGGAAPAEGPIDEAKVREAVEEARRILMQDGGDIEYVGLSGRTVKVRLRRLSPVDIGFEKRGRTVDPDQGAGSGRRRQCLLSGTRTRRRVGFRRPDRLILPP